MFDTKNYMLCLWHIHQ